MEKTEPHQVWVRDMMTDPKKNKQKTCSNLPVWAKFPTFFFSWMIPPCPREKIGDRQLKMANLANATSDLDSLGPKVKPKRVKGSFWTTWHGIMYTC